VFADEGETEATSRRRARGARRFPRRVERDDVTPVAVEPEVAVRVRRICAPELLRGRRGRRCGSDRACTGGIARRLGVEVAGGGTRERRALGGARRTTQSSRGTAAASPTPSRVRRVAARPSRLAADRIATGVRFDIRTTTRRSSVERQRSARRSSSRSAVSRTPRSAPARSDSRLTTPQEPGRRSKRRRAVGASSDEMRTNPLGMRRRGRRANALWGRRGERRT